MSEETNTGRLVVIGNNLGCLVFILIFLLSLVVIFTASINSEVRAIREVIAPQGKP